MVIIECDLDAYVLSLTGIDQDQIHHVAGKGNVINKTIRKPDRIGIIDRDPDSPQPNSLKLFDQKAQFGDLSLLEFHEDDTIRLISIHPRIEEWILNRALENTIRIEDYGYPDDSDKIHDIPKIEEEHDFQVFLNDFLLDDPEFKQMRAWILEAID